MESSLKYTSFCSIWPNSVAARGNSSFCGNCAKHRQYGAQALLAYSTLGLTIT